MTTTVSNPHLSSYVGSPGYSRDLDAVRQVWSPPGVLETAGTLVFLTYLSSPALLTVRTSSGALARSVLDGERERRFLLRMLGLDGSPAWRGGIGNVRTRHVMGAMHRYHARFAGMRQEYLDFITAAIALSPLRVRERLAASPPGNDRAGYWRYISQALSMFGTSLTTEGAAETLCETFTREHARRSADGLELLISLNSHHPRYVQLALPSLFEASRTVVGSLLGDVA